MSSTTILLDDDAAVDPQITTADVVPPTDNVIRPWWTLQPMRVATDKQEPAR
jgi:hypothetical protein